MEEGLKLLTQAPIAAICLLAFSLRIHTVYAKVNHRKDILLAVFADIETKIKNKTDLKDMKEPHASD